MKFLSTIPFLYFYTTRLSKGAIAFHLFFEWLAALLVVGVWGKSGLIIDIYRALVCYLSFISLYEIGYISNDVFSARRELGGRRRGTEVVRKFWIWLWIFSRLTVFFLCVDVLEQWGSGAWWTFFIAMVVTFFLHNILIDAELKVATFIWLAWFRFMAPIIFVVEPSQRMGVAFVAAMTYVSFRQLGYLDSKGLLAMPGRRRMSFRGLYFIMSLMGALATWPYPEASASVMLSVYFGAVVSFSAIFLDLRKSQAQ